MSKDYKKISKIFSTVLPKLKKSVGTYSELVADHSTFWDNIRDIEIDIFSGYMKPHLEITVYMNGTFLEFPIMDIDHFLVGQKIIFPWIKNAYLNMLSINPYKEFESCQITFIDQDGSEDSTYLWNYT